jgi:hypothetical protein
MMTGKLSGDVDRNGMMEELVRNDFSQTSLTDKNTNLEQMVGSNHFHHYIGSVDRTNFLHFRLLIFKIIFHRRKILLKREPLVLNVLSPLKPSEKRFSAFTLDGLREKIVCFGGKCKVLASTVVIFCLCFLARLENQKSFRVASPKSICTLHLRSINASV